MFLIEFNRYALHRMVPEYLAELIKPYNPGLTLTLLNKVLLTIPRACFKCTVE